MAMVLTFEHKKVRTKIREGERQGRRWRVEERGRKGS